MGSRREAQPDTQPRKVLMEATPRAWRATEILLGGFVFPPLLSGLHEFRTLPGRTEREGASELRAGTAADGSAPPGPRLGQRPR